MLEDEAEWLLGVELYALMRSLWSKDEKLLGMIYVHGLADFYQRQCYAKMFTNKNLIFHFEKNCKSFSNHCKIYSRRNSSGWRTCGLWSWCFCLWTSSCYWSHKRWHSDCWWRVYQLFLTLQHSICRFVITSWLLGLYTTNEHLTWV